MTMMDRSRDSRGRVQRMGAAALVLVVVLFFSSSVAPYVRGMFLSIFAPKSDAQHVEQYAGLSRDALMSRLADAEKQLSSVQYQSVLYALLADENAKLRQALHDTRASRSILARVLLRPPRSAYDTLLIDQGTASLVSVGDSVSYQSIALGKIVSTGANTSLVQLFSSSGTDQDVILGKPSAIAVSHGMGGGAYELVIPQSVAVSVGDSVKLSGADSLLAGIVSGVSSKPNDTSQTVRVRLPVSFADLDFVEITPSAQKP